MASLLDASAVTKRLLLISAAGLFVVLAAQPAVAEGRSTGYPIAVDVRETAGGDQAMPFHFAVQPGRVIVMRIRNHTSELHTFAIPEIGLNVAVLPAGPQGPRTTRVRFVLPHYGVYRWFCWPCQLGLHRHHEMGGTLYAWISTDVEIG